MTMQLAAESRQRNERNDLKTAVRITDERLPFTVKLVTTEEEMNKAVSIRHSAYARHVPDFAEQLKRPESRDYEDGTAILLAESRLDGTPLGTMRIQTNQFGPLGLEQSVDLPDWLQCMSLAEATRLGVTEAREGRVVKTFLFKAYYLYCLHAEIDWMVIMARKPIDRQYDALLFHDVFGKNEYIPMSHVGNIPHRVMSFNVRQAEPNWRAVSHPLYNLVFEVNHPDIDIGQVRKGEFRDVGITHSALASLHQSGSRLQ